MDQLKDAQTLYLAGKRILSQFKMMEIIKGNENKIAGQKFQTDLSN